MSKIRHLLFTIVFMGGMLFLFALAPSANANPGFIPSSHVDADDSQSGLNDFWVKDLDERSQFLRLVIRLSPKSGVWDYSKMKPAVLYKIADPSNLTSGVTVPDAQEGFVVTPKQTSEDYLKLVIKSSTATKAGTYLLVVEIPQLGDDGVHGPYYYSKRFVYEK